MNEPDFRAALRALSDGGVEYILVGGLAAVLNGAPVHTYDVDIVPAPDEENLLKLLHVLEKVGVVFRIASRLKPDMTHLRSAGYNNLLTTNGGLDVLGTIGRGWSYEHLRPHTTEMDLGDGMRIHVLDLATIIALKEEVGSDKELAALPVLRRTLQEKQKS